MAADCVTLALNGDVPLDAFARAMQHLSALIKYGPQIGCVVVRLYTAQPMLPDLAP